MNSLSTLRSWLAPAPLPAIFPPIVRGLAGVLLVAVLPSCSHTPEATAATPAATPTLAPAPVVVATPAAPASPEPLAPVAAPVVSKPRVSPAKPQVAPPPVAAVEPAPAATPAPEPVPAAPATRTQAGRVLDESGYPLIGATVMLRSSTKGTSTDANGSYSLEVPTGENTFVVGYGGYQDETAVSRDAQPLNVTLLPTPGSKAKGRRSRQ